MMNIAQVKNDLHKMVVETEDIGLLEKVRQIFDILKTDSMDWADYLTSEQMKMIEKGLDDAENERFVSEEEVRNGIDKILKRK